MLIARRRVGFLVDAAIAGFAVGAGFALGRERRVPARARPRAALLWIVRGFGHRDPARRDDVRSFAMLAKTAIDDRGTQRGLACLPGWLIRRSCIHSAFNHLLLPPLAMTALLLIVLPLVVLAVFQRSERRRASGWRPASISISNCWS